LEDKYVIITNGSGTVGKDTIYKIMNKYVECVKYSSIDTIKEISRHFGCDGEKTEKNRKLWSDLKRISVEYNDMPFKETCFIIDDFKIDLIKGRILLIDIREPEEITKIKNKFPDVITLLVTNDNVDIIESNSSDASVLNYKYDYIIDNSGSIDELNEKVNRFIKDTIN